MHHVPPMFAVVSQSIAAIGYEHSMLFVRFVKGATYRYPGVTFQEFTALRTSRKVGTHLQLKILAKYQGEHVPEAEA